MKALRHIIIYGFMCGIFFQASLATAMDCIVVNSTVAHLPTGTKLLLQSNIDILDEQQVKIVCEDARSKVIHGPYQGPVKIPTAGQPQKLQALGVILKILYLLTSSDDTSTVGADRSALVPKEAVGPWTISLQSDRQEFCLPPDRIPTLWRSDSTWPTILLIENLRNGDRVSASMAQDDATLAWPNSLPIGDRAVFRISDNVGSTNTAVRFALLQGTFSSEIEIALAMAERGCTRQSRLLIMQM